MIVLGFEFREEVLGLGFLRGGGGEEVKDKISLF